MTRKHILSAIIFTFSLMAGCFNAAADEGMWLINAIDKALEKKMQERGLKLKANEIYNSDAEGTCISDAVVSLDFGCTGSIISDNGLLITNHHCAYADVHSLSTDEHNYLEEGYWAMNKGEEAPIKGKGAYFLKSVIDVTGEVEALLESYKERGEAIGSRKLSAIMERKYREETGFEAWLSSPWRGSKYYILLYTVYRDVRLVAAPPVSIAAFGGDIDNWEWPQHKCDFALYRIYTAPDGSPAAYSEDNIPLKPERKMEISLDGYKPGDFTMVIGFPGSINRYSSSAEINFDEKVNLPISNEIRGKQMEIINKWMATDPAIRLKYADYYFGLSNVQELNAGTVKCYGRFGVVKQKKQQDDALQEWIDADPQRKAKWGEVIPMLNEKYAAVSDAERNKIYYRESLVKGSLISRVVPRINILKKDIFASNGIRYRTAIDTSAPDSSEINFCRKFRFCGKRFDAIKVNMLREYENFDFNVEKDLFRYSVEVYYENVDPSYFGPYQKELLSRYTGPDGKPDYEALCNYIWDNSFMTDRGRLESFISGEHTLDEYCADPMYRFYQDVRILDFNKCCIEIEGSPNISSLQKEYTHALYQMRLEKGIAQYPDANSTMRITYGTVGPIEPYDAVLCSWRTTTAGILEKYDPDKYEFNLNGRQKALLEESDWGRWTVTDTDKSKKMFVDFLTDNDITGGNSGSPVLDARGRLIGLAFDGNMESLASDASYTPGYNKCVCVDIRFVLWTLDKYAGMQYILDEIGI